MKKADPHKVIRIFSRQEGKLDARAYASFAAPTLEEDVKRLLKKLEVAGFSQVIALDITQKEFDISVVRAFIPGMEGYYHHKSQHHQRAKAFCAKRFVPQGMT